MTIPLPVTISPTLDAALTRWEQYERPSIPDHGFSLSRIPGKSARGLYVTGSNQPILETDSHILRSAVAPGGKHIALQLADHADEAGVLAVLDTISETLQRHDEIRCRYEPMQWAADGTRLSLIARAPQRLVHLDVVQNEITIEPVSENARCRLFAVGPHQLIVESRMGMLSQLKHRGTGSLLARFPSIENIFTLGEHLALVQSRNIISAIDLRSGTEIWSWADAQTRIMNVCVAEGIVHLAAVRDGRSVHLQINQGSLIDEWQVTINGSIASITELKCENGKVQAILEGPTMPPRVSVIDRTPEDSTAVDSAESFDTVWHEFQADDGVKLTAIVTSPRAIAGALPTILTCYGGFGFPDLAVFEPTIPAWVACKGRYVTGHIRGGGEHGEHWRISGAGKNKRRGIDDLACIARGLITAGLTTAQSLIIVGASHGGTIAASSVLGNRNICAGFVTTAAPLNLLALDKHPLGNRWLEEFGGKDTQTDLRELRAISPLHRARTLPSGFTVPPYLGIVLAEDSRIHAADTYALAQVLQNRGSEAKVWVAPRTGHGSNHLEELHKLGTVVLSFAATSTQHTCLAKAHQA